MSSSDMSPSFIVGIGASAGGLEALEQLFDAMPTDTGFAFVVVQHLSPDFKSMMDELLARHTALRIHRVEDGMQVQRDAIYLIPPKKEMQIRQGRLRLTDKDPASGLSLPIDQFLTSLASDAAERAVAVILSGTGSDGSRGIRAIHDAGGLVVIQTPETARFDGMPLAAQATAVVDLIRDPAEIPPTLVQYAQDPAQFLRRHRLEATQLQGIDGVFRLLRTSYDIDFSHYKPSTVTRRVQRRLAMQNLASLDAYVAQLESDPRELNRLYMDLLIGVTQFFRDREAFRRLESDVIPALVDSVPADHEFRVWSAGCATGEEPYSLAILLTDELRKRGRQPQLKIFATDVHQTSLEVAGIGVYSREQLQHVSPELLERHFVAVASGYQISPELRKRVVFAHHNLIKDAPFTNLDLITCRNLLIYLKPPAQQRALSLFHFGLKKDGYLLLGSSESAGGLSSEFETVDERLRIYRKLRNVRLEVDSRLPLQPVIREARALVPLSRSTASSDSRLLAVYDELLDRYMPCSLLVSSDWELTDTYSGAERYLRSKRRRPSTDVMDLLLPELKTAVAGLLQRCARQGTSVQFSGIPLVSGTETELIRIEIQPIHSARTQTTSYLIAFTPMPDAILPPQSQDSDPAEQSFDAGSASRDRISSLETALQHSRENLQATIEELETSNEELQAANEELVASNEELQSTNEELHSVNEELYTVNAEHQKKIDELSELNRDVTQLLSSLDVGVIFVDRELRIRRFTPLAAEVFNLIDSDVGRPLTSFSSTIPFESLFDDLVHVRDSGEIIETESRDRSGNCFLLRMTPYTVDAGIAGVLLTLVDISLLDETRQAQMLSEARFRGTFDNAAVGMAHVSLDGRWLMVNQRLCDIVGYTRQELLNSSFQEITHPDDLEADLQQLQQLIQGRISNYEMQKRYLHKSGEIVWISLSVSLQRDEQQQPLHCIAVVLDITPRKKIQQALRNALQQRDQFLAMLSHELRNPVAAAMAALELLDRDDVAADIQSRSRAVVRRQIQHIARLLDDLLDVARITQGKIDYRPVTLDLRNVVSEGASAIGQIVAQRSQHLSLRLADDPVWVCGDPARLLQIVENLVNNAVKYTPESGHIDVTLAARSEQAILSVRDDGRGIEPELRERIFELFVQSDRLIDRSDGGMGVGLTLVKGLVDLHGGQIEVHSEGADCGSEFVVTLPLLPLDRQQLAITDGQAEQQRRSGRHAGTNRTVPAKPRKPSSTADGNDRSDSSLDGPLVSQRVVLVEDNQDTRELLATLLQLDGHDVQVAEDGERGLQLISERCPDFAFVDIGLPILDGYEVAKRLRRDFPDYRTHLVAVTGYGQLQDVARALDAGFDTHLTKPVDHRELQRIIREKTACKI